MLEINGHAFGHTYESGILDAERSLQEPGRSIGAFDGDTVIGTATAFSFELTVPGGVVPAAGVSWVGVLPTYRRRGVLRALMAAQLHDVRDRGHEPVAILWASEPAIYGRFGYGLASQTLPMKVPRDPDALRADVPTDPGLRLRLVPAEDWKLTSDVYAAEARTRPGMIGRDDRWHEIAVSDFPSLREGNSALRCVVAEDGSGVRGYARYSTKRAWNGAVPSGTVYVRELLAADDAALAALYRYLFDLDLMTEVDLANVPVDTPLLHWLRNARVARPTWRDGLYLRVLDVGRALSQRSYSIPVDVVLGVVDRDHPQNDGSWRLVGGPVGGRCERTDDTPDVTLGVAELGAVYLGGTELAGLAQAGRVQGRAGLDGGIEALSMAFRWSPQPWCPFVF